MQLVKLCVDNYETQDGLVIGAKRCYESPFYYISYLINYMGSFYYALNRSIHKNKT
jgi:hypothetical protein